MSDVTIDDLPSVPADLPVATYVTTNLLARLRESEVPAVGFVNEGKLFVRGEIDARTNLLWQWLEAGHELGNHTYSHIGIDTVPFEAYRDDLIRGETVRQVADGGTAVLIISTHRAPESDLAATVEELRRTDAVVEVISVLRIEGE